MAEPSVSPERGTFQRNKYLERAIFDGKTEDDPEVKAMLNWFDSWNEHDTDRLTDDEWQKNNLEWDLRTTDWILEKVRTNSLYAQHLYAALCNNDFAKADNVLKILKEQYWSCTWRHAGGVVCNMRQRGDYMDYYCSGMKAGWTIDDDTWGEDRASEGEVTDEVKSDLERLGWIVILNNEG